MMAAFADDTPAREREGERGELMQKEGPPPLSFLPSFPSRKTFNGEVAHSARRRRSFLLSLISRGRREGGSTRRNDERFFFLR